MPLLVSEVFDAVKTSSALGNLLSNASVPWSAHRQLRSLSDMLYRVLFSDIYHLALVWTCVVN